MNDWRTCDHEWSPAKTRRNYRFYCKKCAVFSYVGPAYDLLPDKSKSVFLTGIPPATPYRVSGD